MMSPREEKTKLPIVFFIKIIAVAILISVLILFEDLEQRKWLMTVIKGLNSFLVPSIILSVIRFVIISLYNARHANRSVRGNFVLGINRLTAMLNAVLVMIGIMIAFGIDPKEFVTSLTIVAMAIAVLFRDYITNLLSGLFIMFSEQLSVGDRIKIGDQKGRIVDITFVNIELQNEEDDIVMVPNNLMFTNPMVNLSAHRSNLFTVKFELPLQLGANMDALEDGLRLTLRNHPNLDANVEPELMVLEIGKDFVKFKLELYAISSSNRLHRQIENEILRYILKYEYTVTKSSVH